MALERHGLSFHTPQTTPFSPNSITLCRGKTAPQDSDFAELYDRLTHFALIPGPFRHMTSPTLAKTNNWPTFARLASASAPSAKPTSPSSSACC